MRALLRFFAALMIATGPARAAGDADAEAVARARAELARRLEAAGAGGAIAVRGAPETEAAEAAPPGLRDAELGGCLSLAMLTRTVERLGPEKAQALDGLRASLLSESGEARAGAELLLARAYLVVGFAEEAHAIVASRPGAESAGIAGLAMLAGGADANNFAAIHKYRACGPLYAFILETANALHGAGRPLSAGSLKILSALPQPLRQPIAEALAVHSVGADEAAANELLDLGDGAVETDAGRFVRAVADPSEAGAEALAALGARPGPPRAEALRALSARFEEATPPEKTAAFESDAAEAVAASPLSASISALNIALADRRIARGDVSGAARALGAAWRHDQTRADAIARFSAMAAPRLRSQNTSQRLAALEAIATEPAVAADSLSADDARLAAAAMADFGAEESLAKFMSAASFDASDAAYFKSRALAQSGRIVEARALAAAHARDPRIAKLLLETAYSDADAGDLDDNAPPAAEPSLLSGAYWRMGKLAALMALAKTAPIDAATAKRAAFAFLSARKSPPDALLSADQTGAIKALFATGPKAGAVDPREIERLARDRKSEIAFLRAVVADE